MSFTQENEQLTQHSSQSLNPLDIAIEVMTRKDKFWVDTNCCIAADEVYHRLYGYSIMSGATKAFGKGLRSVDRVVSSGGFLEVFTNYLVSQGFYQTSNPSVGDFGLIECRSCPLGYYATICVDENLWAAKTKDGILFHRGKPFVAMSNPDKRLGSK